MKYFKILIVLFTLVSGFQKTYSQPIRFKASSVSFTDKDNKGSWNEWSDFVKTNVLITVDAKKNLIVVNSAEVQSFKIKSYGEIQDNDEVNIVPFECVDNKFSKCTIFIITKKKENNRMQFYINYNEVKFVYNIYND
jgi:predicted secreted protein